MFDLPIIVIDILRIFIKVMSIIVFLHLSFYTLLALFGMKKPQREYSIKKDEKKFLFLIPAHNEEAVIGNCLEGIRNLDYTQTLMHTVVLADHCSDQTEAVVRNFEEVTLFSNTYQEGEFRGKPHVIGRYLKGNLNFWKKYDYIVFLDADNIISRNFLTEFNSQFLENPEYTVIQGYLDSKNISDSMMSRGYGAAYFITNRAIQYAKHRLGWNASIGGTGFAIQSEYIETEGWNPRSYTEDFEIQVELSIKGKYSTWNHFAKVYDEKPNKLSASHVQRTRWSQGHWLIGITKTGDQVQSLLKKQNLVQWMNRFETLVYSYSMLRSVWIACLAFLILIDISFIEDFPKIFSLLWFWLFFEILNYLVIPNVYIYQEGKEYFRNLSRIQTIKEFFLLWVGYFYSTTIYYFAQVKGFCTWYFPQNHWNKTEHSSNANVNTINNNNNNNNNNINNNNNSGS